MLSSKKAKQNNVQFCTEGKKEIPLNVTSSLSFPLAEDGLLFSMCICKLVLPKYNTLCFFSLQIIFVVTVIADHFTSFKPDILFQEAFLVDFLLMSAALLCCSKVEEKVANLIREHSTPLSWLELIMRY